MAIALVLLSAGLVAACMTAPAGGAGAAVADPASADWGREFRGIDLSPEQVGTIQALKADLDREALGGGFRLRDLPAMARRPDTDARFAQGPIADAIRRYNAGIERSLTPEQWAVYRANNRVPPAG